LHLPTWLQERYSFLARAENHRTFFDRVGEIFPPTDERYKLIEKAYETARKEFREVKRDTGEPYMSHLRSVSLIILVDLRNRNANIIAGGLLHDLVEDIPGWSRERIHQEFNENVAELVWWVTKPSGPRFKTPEEIDRKYHRKLADAPRDAAIIKLADRLHNLVMLWGQDVERMHRKVSETRDFILPLAEKHGVLIHELEAVLSLIEERHES